ncbi:MAG: acyl-CoA dehydratase activase [Lachnospiraceae bacterium]|nr:acyl-CoA dehydratase activase [Lachnospiraceae bacterium]
MSKTYYVCKYTPIELLKAFGGECENLNTMPEGFDYADQIAHPNICGFGKSVLEAVLAGGDQVKELVLVNCCDTIRSVYDLLEDSGQMDFLYMVDMLHGGNVCSRERVAAQLKDLAKKYGEYKGRSFDPAAFQKAFEPQERILKPHIAVLGARMGEELFEMTKASMPLPVVNETCVNNRSVAWTCQGVYSGGDGKGVDREEEITSRSETSVRGEADIRGETGTHIEAGAVDFDALMDWYAGELLGQIPCMRMLDNTGRRQLYQDPSLKGIIYHTVKFCDFYSFEYSEIKSHTDVPLLKIESDYTVQSSGQLLTRLEAFAESLSLNPHVAEEIWKAQRSENAPSQSSAADGAACSGENRTGQSGALYAGADGSGQSAAFHAGADGSGQFNTLHAGTHSGKGRHMGKGYFAGIDSGSTSTDVVILNKKKEMVAGIILPTGAGAAIGAERALEQALNEAKLVREDIDAVVTTGYGRTAIQAGDRSITEITCHARGAHFLEPRVRTVVDIGGQDSKVIRLDEDGSVKNFVMNDKCAAGTGRFLEMMARTMEMSLDEIGKAGLSYDEDITISSMCTVFAESEVVSLIAQNKKPDDIVHGLNKAVAAKTAALVKRVGGEEAYMMTGGVAQNRGLVKTLEERLGTRLIISDKAQLCGALGAALFAADMGVYPSE